MKFAYTDKRRETRAMAKVALVTGAGKRVGKCIAEALQQAGYSLALHYRDSEEETHELSKKLSKSKIFCANFAERGAAQKLVDEVHTHFGRLDLLVASAAMFAEVPFDNIDSGDWDSAIDINLRAPLDLAHAARDSLRENQGNIIFLTDIGAERPYRHHAPYLIAKAGLSRATRVLALEMAPEIRVNAIAPGVVLAPESYSNERNERLRQSIPLKRFGRGEDIADACVFLAGANYISGIELPIDGGRSLGLVD